MKDIDFDELDRAVSSLMSNAGSAPASPPAKPTAPSSPPPEPASQETPPAVSTAESQPVAVTVQTRSASVAPAARRSGRFMDMVNTSAPLKPTASPAPSSPSSREGLSISPRPTVQLNPEPAAPAPDTTTMPDPLDLDSSDESAATDLPASPVIETPVTPPTLESPFIADAKVEKRPLNSAAASGEKPLESILTEPDEPVADSEATDEIPEESKHADEPPAVPQIPELNSDLVAIESSEKVDSVEVTQAVETKAAASEVAAPSVPLGASSITQQYTPKQSSGDQSHAAIYDASDYPQPVSHPAPKKTGWLWVLWVILLLGVGAGGAIVLYNLGII